MKRSMILLPVLLAGCFVSGRDYRSEGVQQYYQGAATETTRNIVSRQRIYHWTTDARQRKAVGIFEKYEIRLKGTRQYRDLYQILNAGGTELLGFVREDGMFFRYNEDGTAAEVGGYPVMDTGLKTFFGFRLSDGLALEEIDPYRE